MPSTPHVDPTAAPTVALPPLALPYPPDAPASAALFERASGVTPGGVNSPVRAFTGVGGTPLFLTGTETGDSFDRVFECTT